MISKMECAVINMIQTQILNGQETKAIHHQQIQVERFHIYFLYRKNFSVVNKPTSVQKDKPSSVQICYGISRTAG